MSDIQNDKSPMAVGLESKNKQHYFLDSTLVEKEHNTLAETLCGIRAPYTRGHFSKAALRRLDEHTRLRGPFAHSGPAPLVPTAAERGRDGIWSLVVEVCPFCGCRHTHGGGSGAQPDLYGHRSSHCGPWFNTPGYILIGGAA